MTDSNQGNSRLAQLLFTVSLALAGANLFLYHRQISAQKEQDLIASHPHSLSVAVMKTIYEYMDPHFRLDKIDKSWYLNDPYEIFSNEIDLFYVPK